MIKKIPINTMYLHFILLLLLAIFIVFRFYDLSLKPVHFDEGVNAHFVEQIKTNYYYDYNPDNYHGPLYFYFLSIADLVFGSDIAVHRALAVSFSFLAWLAIYWFRQSLGISFISLAFLALSPAMNFFSRYSIHESLLHLGVVLFSISIVLIIENKNKLASSLFWLAIFIMATTKETFVIAVFATILYGALYYRHRLLDWRSLLKWHLILVYGLCFIALYSNLFRSPSSLIEFFSAYLPWSKTALASSGHEKPVYYFLQLLFKYELAFFLGFLASFYFMFKGSSTQRYIAFTALISTLIYSLIPYKTPWCLISFFWPFIFCLDWLMQKLNKKTLVVGISLVLLSTTAYQSISLNFMRYSDFSHNYVYVQSTKELKIFTDAMKKYAQIHASFKSIDMHILLSSIWPLPWLLKDFKNKKYYASVSPAQNTADIILLDKKDYVENIDSFKDYYAWHFFVRASQIESTLLINQNTSADFLSWFKVYVKSP